jgi:hypothetical protein
MMLFLISGIILYIQQHFILIIYFRSQFVFVSTALNYILQVDYNVPLTKIIAITVVFFV